MKINICWAYAIAVLLMLIIPTILVFALKRKPKTLKVTAGVLITIYFGLLFVGTAGKISLSGENFTISFDFSKRWFSADFSWFETSARNVVINLFLLFPIGFAVYLFSPKHAFLKTVIFALAVSIFIELYQWILPIHRNSEISDILFNTVSGIISASYAEFLKKFGAFKQPKQETIPK